MPASNVFRSCVVAIANNSLIRRENKSDKEFHFQNWFLSRLQDAGLNFDAPGRNSYPDFTLVDHPEGFEIKGLAYPGRANNYDSNSQVPKGIFNGRSIYYVFGRYPNKPDGDEYPVLDLVVCHGSFLNADTEYVHKNRSLKGFGSYGDIMIRDRKMYVVPTPYMLASGTANHKTLILPSDVNPGDGFTSVGELNRQEADEVLISYTFDLQSNEITATKIANPHAGRVHSFRAWQISEAVTTEVVMQSTDQISQELEAVADESE